MRFLDLGQIQQCCRTWVTWQGKNIYGSTGLDRKPKTWKHLISHSRGINTETLKRQRWTLRRGSGTSVRNESTCVATHLYMKAMLGISSVLLFLSQLAKMLWLSYYCLFLLFKGTGKKHRTGSAWKGVGRGREGESVDRKEKWPKQCMHMWINE
jgi:hypothetical protein